jgi:hypothetical protein
MPLVINGHREYKPGRRLVWLAPLLMVPVVGALLVPCFRPVAFRSGSTSWTASTTRSGAPRWVPALGYSGGGGRGVLSDRWYFRVAGWSYEVWRTRPWPAR